MYVPKTTSRVLWELHQLAWARGQVLSKKVRPPSEERAQDQDQEDQAAGAVVDGGGGCELYGDVHAGVWFVLSLSLGRFGGGDGQVVALCSSMRPFAISAP